MEVAKISSKGQVTIPISVRNTLKLKAGDKIVIWRKTAGSILKIPQCWHSSGWKNHSPEKLRKRDLHLRKKCRTT